MTALGCQLYGIVLRRRSPRFIAWKIGHCPNFIVAIHAVGSIQRRCAEIEVDPIRPERAERVERLQKSAVPLGRGVDDPKSRLSLFARQRAIQLDARCESEGPAAAG